MRAVTVLCNAALTSCISSRGAIANTPLSSTRASSRSRALPSTARRLWPTMIVSPRRMRRTMLSSAPRGQHAIGIHEHDERADAVIAQIGDGFGIGQRQGNAIAGLACAWKELVHQDEPHTDARHDL